MRSNQRVLLAYLILCVTAAFCNRACGEISSKDIEYKIYLYPSDEAQPPKRARIRRVASVLPSVKTVDYSVYTGLGSIYTDTFPIRGLHVTSWAASSLVSFNRLVGLVNRTELNALVLDLKEAEGRIAYDSRLDIAKELGTLEPIVSNIDGLITIMRENRIFPIARICVFKDTLLAHKKPEWAVKNKSGNIWQDKKGQSWLDQYNREVWDYIVMIAEEAAQRGFREIQFDYVRFPSDGQISDCVFPAKANFGETISPARVIRRFLEYAKNRLKPYGVAISADLFGLTCSSLDDLNIGQVIEEVAKEVNYVCPMTYPSHYYRGMYNLQVPEAEPYKTVFTSMKDVRVKLGDTNPCGIRPWLQDFSLKVKYNAFEVQEQIRAVYENGISEWLLWNPRCVYTEEVLRPESERKAVAKKIPNGETLTKRIE